ncbi:class I SAM-dependent methyltransferase [Polaribacter sp. BAL334]|uniref:class I SAM-dependent methyltransferase n=1 Tax=Polaribacter sp. BAL334 TaxID=1708178 RepID=UPI0018D235E2|nr:class I SAM-dependent methyltransferase [Polaribacter sp. BAL334]MBG7612854.1 class I SAM-dependent methyltransferase [Polaribacter sp. BAL334]
MRTKDWFTDWFNTPYYHILYKDRNDLEAQQFIRNITAFLPLSENALLLDLPCGKGRHSVFLNSLGYKVIGADLSENSIQFAKKFENSSLKFIIQDMREPFDLQYDAVFNLFTSFGYFEEDSEDILVLQNIKNCLKENGYFVFDFLNASFVKDTLVASETKMVDGITFHIQRKIEDGFILKHISFFADGEHHQFTESVKYLDLQKMTAFFEKVGLNLKHVFGDYQLHPFDENYSKRLILIAQ